MYQIVYEKQAVRDIKNLKPVGLDKKAKELMELDNRIDYLFLTKQLLTNKIRTTVK